MLEVDPCILEECQCALDSIWIESSSSDGAGASLLDTGDSKLMRVPVATSTRLASSVLELVD